MSSGAALDLSFPELIQALSEKLTFECTRVRTIRLSHGATSITTLETEVSAPRPPKLQQNLTVSPPDRISRKQGVRTLGAYSLVEEPTAASEPVTTGDNFPHRPIHPRGVREGRKFDYSNDPRVSLLAQIHHLDASKLDSDIKSTD